MNRTKIDWADYTWNPVTGCYKGCPYCYAAKIANRFGLNFAPKLGDYGMEGAGKFDSTQEGMDTMLEINKPYKDYCGKKNSFPMAFAPTFHRYRLEEPQHVKKASTIFVCSMADLFGDWVPNVWINTVLEACEKAPWHRYLFLTKNSKRYRDITFSDNMWYGATITGAGFERSNEYLSRSGNRSFLSIEPLLGSFAARDMWRHLGWVIIGAETGNRKGKVIPEREWIEYIVEHCSNASVPVFMKESLRKIWGEQLIQEYPW